LQGLLTMLVPTYGRRLSIRDFNLIRVCCTAFKDNIGA